MTLNSLLLNDWKVPGQELGIIFQFYLRIFLVKSSDFVDRIATTRRKMNALKFINYNPNYSDEKSKFWIQTEVLICAK